MSPRAPCGLWSISWCVRRCSYFLTIKKHKNAETTGTHSAIRCRHRWRVRVLRAPLHDAH